LNHDEDWGLLKKGGFWKTEDIIIKHTVLGEEWEEL
jgi:hypothetical protein